MLLQLPAAKNIVMTTVILEVSSQVFRQISSKYVCIKLVALPSLAHTIFYCKPHKHMALNLIKIIPYKGTKYCRIWTELKNKRHQLPFD